MRILLLSVLALCCLPLQAETNAFKFVRPDIITDPSPSRFSVCYNTGCRELQVVALTAAQWRQIESVFRHQYDRPAQERVLIKIALQRMERFVGRLTGTSHDKAKNARGFFAGSNQMDCIDEATNTTLYLVMMQKAGLLKFHSVEKIAHRFFPLLMLPHSSAVIRERHSNRKYAVDAWFRDNGQPPYIISLRRWRRGWKPN